MNLVLKLGLAFCLGSLMNPANAAERQLLWGDTHLHTNYSFDAFLNGNHTADPETAYRYARGYPVIHPYNRTRVRIGTPLDFLVVSDHAEFFGGIRDIYFEGIQDPDPNIIERLVYWYNERLIRSAIDEGRGPEYFRDLLPAFGDPREAAAKWREDVGAVAPPGAELSASNAWNRLRRIADAHNRPGEFSALIGWEWSSNPGGANLHRVVFTDASGEAAASFMPFASTDSPYPEDLWAWLDRTQNETGVRFISIPHNSNISRGFMFPETTLEGEPINAEYASARLRWEPVAEITQIKGDSETHPDLSPDDPFADFELYPWWIANTRIDGYTATEADYLRSALRTGLELENRIGENPYRFGVIGSTDSHTGLSSAEEPNFWGKMAYDSIPENKQGVALTDGPTGWTMQAAGLAAVWAEENTRASIMDGFHRREVYATTGPRIRVRVFGGYDFSEEDLSSVDFADRGYARGVPMGGELRRSADDLPPTFMVRTAMDPRSANLDRVQMVKGWVDEEGTSHEKVYDIAWSGDRIPDAEGEVPAVGDTVDRVNGTFSNTIGASQLETVWTDPDFNADRLAFYYIRVLEIPTPRHAQLDAIALGLDAPTEGPEVIQERAYASPIWYSPARAR